MNTHHYRDNTNVPWDQGFAEISPIQEMLIDSNFTDRDCFKSAAFVQDIVI